MIPEPLLPFFQELFLAAPDSHKGQNGKLLIIGGSHLFHAASKWSLDTASKIVDMVFYSSVPENNVLIQKVKEQFWNGIVIERNDIEKYAEESDCILIGPGMERSEETSQIVNTLLQQFLEKKWVIDAGALQMVDPSLLAKNHIITPHHKEIGILKEKNFQENTFPGVTLLKGEVDTVLFEGEKYNILGGNPGMTKGGTGDVLAGLIAGLYCKNSALVSSIVGSYVNKKAGDTLFKQVGPYFNASDLVKTIPSTLWELQKEAQSLHLNRL